MEKMINWIKEHKVFTSVIATIMFAMTVVLVCLFFNKNYIEFNVQDQTKVEVEYGSNTQMKAVTAQGKGTIFNRKGTPVEVSVEGQVEYDKLGVYELCYFAKYKNTTSTTNVTVVVKDTKAPELYLVSDPTHYTSPVGHYQEEGFKAIDNYDGDISQRVVSEERDGKVIYKVSDSSGNETVKERTIIYKDVIAPTITLKGSKDMSLYVGGSYSEPGYLAKDECDGDITKNVIVKGSVDPNKVGIYTIVYRVSDTSGNTTEVKRTVRVKNIIPASGDKVIYLTFDDGPSAYTPALLDVLDKYNVKATFFVTGARASYRYLIGEAYRRGHTIAVHTYSHKYEQIYSSLDAYLADFQKIKNIVIEQTGEEPWLIRFPGGTSNTVSKKYCTGVMTAIVEEMTSRGYYYCDWNVSSEDAAGASTEQQIINNVINGCAKRKSAIVLQHDIKKNSVNAVDNIIEWGLANGYTFKAMDKDTSMVHSRLKN